MIQDDVGNWAVCITTFYVVVMETRTGRQGANHLVDKKVVEITEMEKVSRLDSLRSSFAHLRCNCQLYETRIKELEKVHKPENVSGLRRQFDDWKVLVHTLDDEVQKLYAFGSIQLLNEYEEEYYTLSDRAETMDLLMEVQTTLLASSS